MSFSYLNHLFFKKATTPGYVTNMKNFFVSYTTEDFHNSTLNYSITADVAVRSIEKHWQFVHELLQLALHLQRMWQFQFKKDYFLANYVAPP
jgi:hypothetical protein